MLSLRMKDGPVAVHVDHRGGEVEQAGSQYQQPQVEQAGSQYQQPQVEQMHIIEALFTRKSVFSSKRHG